MIVADKKPIEEIVEAIKDKEKILILGCNECVTVCEAGGKKEVEIGKRRVGKECRSRWSPYH